MSLITLSRLNRTS